MNSAAREEKAAAGKKDKGPPDKRRTAATYLPLGLFLALAVLFFVGLFSGDPSKLPSALIGKPVPALTLAPLEGLVRNGEPVPGFSHTDLARGEVTIVNVWASWCVPCIQEHPFLVKFAKQSRAPLFGINEKDKTTAARRFLGRYGNPFTAVGVDPSGKAAIEWGVYGVPETFIVSGEGTILYKHVGPIDDQIITDKLMPAVTRARQGG